MPNKIKIMYNAQGLVPAIVQDRETKQVLMLAWMNQESLKLTIKTRFAHFWSRSRQTLWKKGETSGNLLKVHEIWVDCDADTLLLTVDPAGPACHTGHITCFYRQLENSNV